MKIVVWLPATSKNFKCSLKQFILCKAQIVQCYQEETCSGGKKKSLSFMLFGLKPVFSVIS